MVLASLQPAHSLTFSLGETIPIRLFLGGFDLTPTFREVNKKYSTRYYLSLVLIDEGKSNANSFLFNIAEINTHVTSKILLRVSAIELSSAKGESHPTLPYPTPTLQLSGILPEFPLRLLRNVSRSRN